MTEEGNPPQPTRDIQAILADNPELSLLLGIGLIVLLTIVTYIPTFSNGFIWDDNYYVTDNKLLTNWEGLQRIWLDIIPHPTDYAPPQYYPLTFTSFWIEYHAWGLNPVGYHVDNLLLHTLNALIVWLLLRKLDVPGAWLAGLIFALHPINVESVAWVAERKNVLSLLFFLSSLYVYLRYLGLIRGREPGHLKVRDNLFKLPDDPQRLYALTVVLFLAALFSKTVTSSMPAVALLLVCWKRRRLTLSQIFSAVPLLIVGGLMGMLTAYVEKWRVGVAARPAEWIYAPTPAGQFFARCMIAGKVVWFYIYKLLLPFPLLFNYPRWKINPTDYPQYGFAAAALAAVIILFALRRKLSAAPLVAVLFYLITLFPAMGFVNVWPMQYSFVADHFVYLPSIGLIALVAAIAWKHSPPEPLAGVVVVGVAVMMGLNWPQERMYKDSATLWSRTWTNSDHRSWLAANNLGAYLLDQGRPDLLPFAEEKFNQTLELKPKHPEARLNLARVALRRGSLAASLRARAATNPSPELAALIPTTTPAEYEAKALDYYQQAIAVQPNYVDGHFYLAKLLLSMGRTEEATQQLQTVVALDAKHYDAHLTLGDLAMKANQDQDALDHYALAVEAEPDLPGAHAKLGTVLLKMGRVDEGFNQWTDTMKLAPTDPSWPTQFGQDMVASNEIKQAVIYFQEALAVDPKFLPAINGMGVAAARYGLADQAKKISSWRWKWIRRSNPPVTIWRRWRPASSTRPPGRARNQAPRPRRRRNLLTLDGA